MRCALINLATGIVENIIVADPDSDPVDDGYILIGNPPAFVRIDLTTWNGTDFIGPDGSAPPVSVGGLEML